MPKFKEEIIKQCEDWIRENGLIEYGGASLSDCCEHLGISYRTFYRWARNAKFAQSIKKAKEDFKNNLETDLVKSLARTAKGEEWDQTTIEYDKNGDEFRRTVKHIKEKPNVGAAIFLLTNINPDTWSNVYKEKESTTAIDSVTLSNDDGEL